MLDLVLKIYTRRLRSIGLLIFGIGSVWLVLHSGYLYTSGQFPIVDAVALQYGLLAAGCVTVSNIVLLECLRHLPISTASTIYRLNTIPLVIIAVLFLGEPLTLAKSSGVVAGVVAVLLLYHAGGSDPVDHSRTKFYTALIILAACARALYGIFTKMGITYGGNANAMMLLAAMGFVAGGLWYAVWRERTLRLSRAVAGFSLVAGALVYAVVWLLTTALALGDASVVVPIANMGFIAAFVFSVLLRLEVLTARKVLAILCVVVSLVLLTSTA